MIWLPSPPACFAFHVRVVVIDLVSSGYYDGFLPVLRWIATFSRTHIRVPVMLVSRCVENGHPAGAHQVPAPHLCRFADAPLQQRDARGVAAVSLAVLARIAAIATVELGSRVVTAEGGF